MSQTVDSEEKKRARWGCLLRTAFVVIVLSIAGSAYDAAQRLEANIEYVAADQAQLARSVSALKNTVEELKDKVDEIKSDVGDLKNRLSYLESKVNSLEDRAR
jgi:peptidoglycan hydrolase CwlO-like protein